jgi:uncharacterized membrane-anchored protein
MTAIAGTETTLSKSKVPQVTLAFWIIKILATTVGETGGDALSMTLELGYAVSTGIFFAFFVVTAAAQIKARAYHPFLYWAVIVATTTVGTTTSDFLTRTAGLGYTGASLVLFAVLMTILVLWRLWLGTISVEHINNPKAETCYWMAILVSNTLGTALGDAVADTSGLGFAGGALAFFGVIAFIAALYFFTKISHTILFWAAFILTRPLGATLGDVLTKPKDQGGLHLDRIIASLVIFMAMVCIILFTTRRDREPVEAAPEEI